METVKVQLTLKEMAIANWWLLGCLDDFVSARSKNNEKSSMIY